MASRKDISICVLNEGDFLRELEEKLHCFMPESSSDNSLKFTVRDLKGSYRNLEIRPAFPRGRVNLMKRELILVDFRFSGHNTMKNFINSS